MQDIIIRLIIFSFSFLFFIFPSFSEEKNPAWWTAPFEDTLESRNTIKMGEVFTSGYEAIQDKYINVVDLPFLISESLKQLSSKGKYLNKLYFALPVLAKALPSIIKTKIQIIKPIPILAKNAPCNSLILLPLIVHNFLSYFYFYISSSQ